LDSISTIAYYYRVKAKTARKCYKQKKDGYKDWNQAAHCEEYLIFPENITPHLAIDEVNFTHGELYTFMSSRDRSGRAKKLVAMVKGTRSEDIIKVLNHNSLSKRLEVVEVVEVSLDMASTMRKACEVAFPKAVLVIDRFHVVRLVMDAMQHARIDQRWKEIDK
jgi:transposase